MTKRKLLSEHLGQCSCGMCRTPEQRFFSKVLKSENCWLWTAAQKGRGYIIGKGYGNFFFNGELQGAHCVSWQIHFGEIPNGLFVLHTCDNPPCVNPEHLFLGTPLDNVTDMDKKKRRVTVSLRGSLNGRAKITEAAVKEIRALYATGKKYWGCAGLAKKYGVCVEEIRDVARKKRWSFIP